MTVYVDDMRTKYGRLVMCHMVADTDHELREMAKNIGVSQRWHQGDHFDICKAKKALAIEHGAVQITRRECVAMVSGRRKALRTQANAS